MLVFMSLAAAAGTVAGFIVIDKASPASVPRFEGKVIDHDAVKSIPQKATEAELFWQPSMTIGGRTCHIYPAVDAIGQVSGGLKPTGDRGGHCKGPTDGQCYVRTTTVHGKLAFLYGWFSVSSIRRVSRPPPY